jgi:hypothetical protein
MPVVDAYETLGKEFRGKNAAQKKEANEFWGHDDTKPSGRAYLVLAGAIVTLLAPLKIIGCSVSLLSNYVYSPVTIILTGLLLLLRKIGWMERVGTLDDFSTAGKCIFWVAFWPLRISIFMEWHTSAKSINESTVYLDKLHFLQLKLESLIGNQSEDEQSDNEQGEEWDVGQWEEDEEDPLE